MKEEVERIKKLVGIDHNRWEQPCTCDKCKNMCKVPCIGTPKDIEAIIDAGYADRLKETIEYYEFKEEVINKINETRRKLYIQSWKEQLIRSGMRQKRKDVFESPDGLYIEMVYENKAFVSYRPIKETQDLPIDAKYIPLLTRIFGENILAEIGGGKIFITTGKYAVNFWCWGK